MAEVRVLSWLKIVGQSLKVRFEVILWVVVVVFTDRDPDIVRIISLRKADKDERRAYAAWLRDRLDTC